MNARSPLSPGVRALLDQERVIRPISASQRASAMARARVALAAPIVETAASSAAAPRPHWLAAAAAALVVGVAVGAAAYQIHTRMAPGPTTHSAPAVPAPRGVASVPDEQEPAAAVPVQAPAVVARVLSPGEAARAELYLLRQARAAVARGDFAAALPPIAEHARRFKNGRLVEEREALRVKALGGLGRTAEARQAAAVFQSRFPRSVLLPAVSQMVVSGR